METTPITSSVDIDVRGVGAHNLLGIKLYNFIAYI